MNTDSISIKIKQADNRLDIIVFFTVDRLQRRLPELTFYVRHTGLRFSIKEKYNNKPEISLELPINYVVGRLQRRLPGLEKRNT